MTPDDVKILRENLQRLHDEQLEEYLKQLLESDFTEEKLAQLVEQPKRNHGVAFYAILNHIDKEIEKYDSPEDYANNQQLIANLELLRKQFLALRVMYHIPVVINASPKKTEANHPSSVAMKVFSASSNRVLTVDEAYEIISDPERTSEDKDIDIEILAKTQLKIMEETNPPLNYISMYERIAKEVARQIIHKNLASENTQVAAIFENLDSSKNINVKKQAHIIGSALKAQLAFPTYKRLAEKEINISQAAYMAEAFKRIYKALYQAQSGPKLFWHFLRRGRGDRQDAALIDELITYAEKHKNSRAAQAWELTKEYYIKLKDGGKSPELEKKIYELSYEKSPYAKSRYTKFNGSFFNSDAGLMNDPKKEGRSEAIHEALYLSPRLGRKT